MISQQENSKPSSAVGHVENGAESQCPKQDLKTFGCYSRGTMTGRLQKGLIGTKCTAQGCIEGMKVIVG